jgi:pimeloyl-ACP methyl ester carboxylesterase
MANLTFPLCGFAQKSMFGSWIGQMQTEGIKLDILVRFFEKDGLCEGNIDIPAQGVKYLPLQKVACDPNGVHFEIESMITRAFYDGKYEAETAKISGKFLQGNYSGTFFLAAFDEEKEAAMNNQHRLNQHFTEEEINFSNGEIVFAGTLALPKNRKEKCSAVVLLTGSGAQDRNEEIVGFKIFEKISDELTRLGFAVLRYDDRGVGKTKGGNVFTATTADFAKDAAKAVDFLKTRTEINPKKIGVLGHSEGGIVAPMLLNFHEDLYFLVLMAGTGVRGSEVLDAQTSAVLRLSGIEETTVAKLSEMNRAVYEKLAKNDDNSSKESLRALLRFQFGILPESVRDNYYSEEQYANQISEVQFRQLTSPWMRFFLTYDPQEALKKVKIPTLLLFAEKDIQVLPSQNKIPMENALQKAGNKQFKSVLIRSANHLFEPCETGNLSEYGSKKFFAEGFFEAISEFLMPFVGKE